MLTNTGHESGLNAAQDFFNPDGYVPANLLFTPSLTRIAGSNFEAAAGAFAMTIGGQPIAPASPPDAVGSVTIGQNSLADPQSSTLLAPGGTAPSIGQGAVASAIRSQPLSAQPTTPDYTVTQSTDGSGNQVTTYAMNGTTASVQVTYLANSTQVVVTGAGAGDTQTYSMAANAQIVFGENQSISAGSGTNEILIGGTGANISSGSAAGGNLMVALGVGVQVSLSSQDTSAIAIANNNDAATTNTTIANQASSNIWVSGKETATIHSLGENTNETLGGSDNLTVDGDNVMSSNAGSDQITIAPGTGGLSTTINGSNENIKLTSNVGVIVNGANNTINSENLVSSITLQNTTITSGTDTVYGASNVEIDDGAQANQIIGIGTNGGGTQIVFDQSNANVTISNTGNLPDQISVQNGSVTGDTVNLGQNAQANVYGGATQLMSMASATVWHSDLRAEIRIS